MNLRAIKINLPLILSLLLTLFLFVISVSIAKAGYGEVTPPTPKIMVEKWVWNPGSNSFVENLSVNQFLFLPDQEVAFKVEVKNTGNKDLDNVEVNDRLPNEVIFVSGPGDYNPDKHTLTFKIDKLSVNESKAYELKAKIKSADSLPSNVFCTSNLAEVRADNMVSQDTTSFCAQKKVLGVVKELPKTGPGSLVMMLGLTIISSGAAIYFAKKA